MKKLLISLSLFLLLIPTTEAQEYDTGIGVKIGMAPGLSFKYYTSRYNALEGILTYRWNGLNVTGLIEFHIEVFDTEGFFFYYGGGVHLGIWDSGKFLDKVSDNHTFNTGLDGIMGLEYSFPRLPLAIGMDWKPYWNIISDSRFMLDEISLTVRYLIR